MRRLSSLLAIMAILTILPVYGQRERNVVYRVGVGEFTYKPAAEDNASTAGKVLKGVAETLLTGQTARHEPQYADAVRASILSGLSHVYLFRTFDCATAVQESAGNEPVLHAEGLISNMSTISKVVTTKDSKGISHNDTYYRGQVNVIVNLKDVTTGTVVDSHTFDAAGGDANWLSSRDKAMTNAIEYLSTRITKHYNKLFPLYASIVEGGNVKKQKQKEVYIDLGELHGVCRGMHFDVFLSRTVAGKEARTQIGQLKISEVEGDEISLCKVTRGGNEIKSALEDGKSLVIISR